MTKFLESVLRGKRIFGIQSKCWNKALTAGLFSLKSMLKQLNAQHWKFIAWSFSTIFGKNWSTDASLLPVFIKCTTAPHVSRTTRGAFFPLDKMFENSRQISADDSMAFSPAIKINADMALTASLWMFSFLSRIPDKIIGNSTSYVCSRGTAFPNSCSQRNLSIRANLEFRSTVPVPWEIFHPVLARRHREMPQFQTVALLFPGWSKCYGPRRSSIPHNSFLFRKPLFHTSSLWHIWKPLQTVRLCRWKKSHEAARRHVRSQNTGARCFCSALKNNVMNLASTSIDAARASYWSKDAEHSVQTVNVIGSQVNRSVCAAIGEMQ